MAKHQTQFVDVALLAGARRKMRSHSSRICCIFAASTTAERQFDVDEVLPQSAYLAKTVMRTWGDTSHSGAAAAARVKNDCVNKIQATLAGLKDPTFRIGRQR